MPSHPSASSLKVSYGLIALVLLLVVASILWLAPKDLAYQKAYLSEGGLFETLSVVGYALCIGLIWTLWRPAAALSKWYFTALLTLFICRELDLDKSQFTLGLLKSRQYTSELVGLPERVVSIILLLFILLVLALILIRETRSFLIGLARGAGAQVAVALTVVLLVGSKAIDGLGRKLADFGISISQESNQLASVVEEVAECGIPLMLAIAIIFSPALRR